MRLESMIILHLSLNVRQETGSHLQLTELQVSAHVSDAGRKRRHPVSSDGGVHSSELRLFLLAAAELLC